MSNIEETTTTPAADSQEQSQSQGDSQVEVAESEAKETTPATEPTETTTENGEEQQSDSFFDPNQVPEELLPAYKQMQAAFTKKTQEIAETRKQAEELQKQAEGYKQYEQYIPIIEEMLKGQSQQQASPEMAALEQQLKTEGYSDEAVNMMKIGAEFVMRHMGQKQQAYQQQTWIQQQLSEAVKVDERLNDSNLVYDMGDGEQLTFGQMVEELVAADSRWIQDPVAATKRAIKKVDALIGRAKTEGKEELSASAKQKAAKFPQSNSSPQGAVKTNKTYSSVREAYEEAKKELGA